jgi:DNA-binding transcriptional MerR regulator
MTMTNERDWSIQEVARLAGTTSRTLRHYGDIGLLPATRVGANGYRRYDADALLALQRILLLRELGLTLPAIADVLRGQRDDAGALSAHLIWLEAERERVSAQIVSVRTTIDKLNGGEQLMADEMFDGFDHTVYREEVEARWGGDAYAVGDDWWRSKTVEEKAAWRAEQDALASDWAAAAAASADSTNAASGGAGTGGADAGDAGPTGARAQALARRQYEWLASVPGTPGYPQGPTKEYFAGLAELYAADDRFGAVYGGPTGASFVRAAMLAWADRHL